MRTEAGMRLLGSLRKLLPNMPLTWEGIEDRIAAIEAEAVAAERVRITEAAATAVSHLAFECKNSRVRQGVQMGGAAVLRVVNPEETEHD